MRNRTISPISDVDVARSEHMAARAAEAATFGEYDPEVQAWQAQVVQKQNAAIAYETQVLAPALLAREREAEQIRLLWEALAGKIDQDILTAYHQGVTEQRRIDGLVADRLHALEAHNRQAPARTADVPAWAMLRSSLEGEVAAYAQHAASARAACDQAAGALVRELLGLDEGERMRDMRLRIAGLDRDTAITLAKEQYREIDAGVTRRAELFGQLRQHGASALQLPDPVPASDVPPGASENGQDASDQRARPPAKKKRQNKLWRSPLERKAICEN